MDKNSSPQPVESIDLPTVTDYTVGRLNPQSRYLFYLTARNSAGAGEPIIKEGETMLDGGNAPYVIYLFSFGLLNKLLISSLVWDFF